LLACLQAGNLAAQDHSAFGALPQSGNAAQPLPGGEKYTFGSIAPALPGGASLAPALEVIDQPEPPLRLRGAREIELFRRLAPSVALIVTDEPQGSASLIATKSIAGGGRSGVLLTSAHVVGNGRESPSSSSPRRTARRSPGRTPFSVV